MDQTLAQTDAVNRVAMRLQDDIKSRGLGPGERYYTAAEAGALLGVSVATASRAMGVLARRKMLIRKRSQGTFIGPGARKPSVNVRTVHVLIEEEEPTWQVLRFDLLLQALRQALGGVNVQISFIPRNDELAFTKQLLGAARSAGHLAGVVAISCSREVYGYLSEAAIPTVVFGTLHDDHSRLASIDLDYRESGFRLGEYLINQGHKRLALFAHELHRPGDNAFLDGLSEAMGAAGLPANALVVRTLPPEPAVVAAELRRVVNGDWPAKGIIARAPRMVQLLEAAMDELGDERPAGLELVFEGHATDETERARHTHTQSTLPFVETARRIGALMHDLLAGQLSDERRVVIPMELLPPSGDNS